MALTYMHGWSFPEKYFNALQLHLLSPFLPDFLDSSCGSLLSGHRSTPA